MAPDDDEQRRTTAVDPVVRTALARLATGVPPPHPRDGSPADYVAAADTSPPQDPAAVVHAAEAAAAEIDAAAAFRTGGGLERLRNAVELAAGRGDRRTARRGQRVLAAFERARAALSEGDDPSNPPEDGHRTATEGPDHFRPGRGTALRPAVEAGDE